MTNPPKTSPQRVATRTLPPAAGRPAAGRRPSAAGGSAPRPRNPAPPNAHLVRDLDAAVRSWSPTAARILLGLVLGWFGYHELVAPGLWTGYVPIVATTSSLAKVLVLGHGWVLSLLAVAFVIGIAPRLSAAIASLLLLEIVVSLTVSAGLSDLVLRDVGVLGLAVSLLGGKGQRLVLRR